MPEDEWLPIVRERAIDAMMAMIRDDLAALDVHHEVFFSERSLHAGNGERDPSRDRRPAREGLIYRGKLPPPKGQMPEDWEDREQTLFRSTEFGDDIDRPLMKSDGTLHLFRRRHRLSLRQVLRGFGEMIDVLGADHGGYVKRMKAAVTAVTDGEASSTSCSASW